MPVAVNPHAVAGGGHLGGEAGVARNLLADEKKGSHCAASGERCQHGWRSLWMRTVVERQHAPAAVDRGVPDAEQTAKRRSRGREPRQEVRAGAQRAGCR